MWCVGIVRWSTAMVVEECVCVHVCARGRAHCNNTIGITVTIRVKCVSIR